LHHGWHYSIKNNVGEDGPNNKLLEDMPRDITDTQEFLYALELLSEPAPLSVAHINQTLRNFKGPYCFMIWDKLQHNKVFVIRGEDRFLHKAEILSDGKPWGILINTMDYEIDYTMRLIVSMGKLLGYNLSYNVERLEMNSIYEYKIGSYILGDKLDKTYVHPKTQPMTQVNRVMGGTGFVKDENLNWVIAELSANNLDLTYTELLVLSEILFSKSFLLFTEDEMDHFGDLLLEFDAKHNHKGRRKIWASIKKKADVPAMDIYKLLNLEFPYFFNSKSLLKKAEKNVK